MPDAPEGEEVFRASRCEFWPTVTRELFRDTERCEEGAQVAHQARGTCEVAT